MNGGLKEDACHWLNSILSPSGSVCPFTFSFRISLNSENNRTHQWTSLWHETQTLPSNSWAWRLHPNRGRYLDGKTTLWSRSLRRTKFFSVEMVGPTVRYRLTEPEPRQRSAGPLFDQDCNYASFLLPVPQWFLYSNLKPCQYPDNGLRVTGTFFCLFIQCGHVNETSTLCCSL